MQCCIANAILFQIGVCWLWSWVLWTNFPSWTPRRVFWTKLAKRPDSWMNGNSIHQAKLVRIDKSSPSASTISIIYITRIQMFFRWLHKMCWGYRAWGRCERPALRLLPLPDHHPGRVDGVNARHRLIRIRAVSHKQHKHHRISCWSCAAGSLCLLIVKARHSFHCKITALVEWNG